MVLSTTQLSLCFQSYWYLWLTNGLSGLFFIGIDIGIAGFYLRKFRNNKLSKYQNSANSTKRPFSPSQVNTSNDPNENSTVRKSALRPVSARSIVSIPAEDNHDFAVATLELVNNARQKYNAPPVELNDQLSDIAQRWANHMAQTGKLEHSPAELRNFGRQTLGENYAISFQSELTASKMVRKWMKEGQKYQFGSNGRRDTENFTQLVWQETKEIGVGRAHSREGNWWYGVVVFDPPGNIPNQFANNVYFISEQQFSEN